MYKFKLTHEPEPWTLYTAFLSFIIESTISRRIHRISPYIALACNFDVNHYNECMHRKAQMEAYMWSSENPLLLDEALRKLTLKNATGFDKIPNEVLKRPGIREGLFKLFSYCFESGLVPSTSGV